MPRKGKRAWPSDGEQTTGIGFDPAGSQAIARLRLFGAAAHASGEDDVATINERKRHLCALPIAAPQHSCGAQRKVGAKSLGARSPGKPSDRAWAHWSRRLIAAPRAGTPFLQRRQLDERTDRVAAQGHTDPLAAKRRRAAARAGTNTSEHVRNTWAFF